nr:hypothetical protein KPHV_00600 [Kitasatospora purpeofusca]
MSARSLWSRRNVDNVARSEAAGLMLPSGRAAVDAAKTDGRWTAAYTPSSETEVPHRARGSPSTGEIFIGLPGRPSLKHVRAVAVVRLKHG